MAEEQQDVETLKRRGRRRLVGAVALVLAAVIVLPMVFDPEPKSTLPPVSVKIPGENDSAFQPKPPAPKPVPKAEPVAKAEPAPPKEPEAPKAEPQVSKEAPAPKPAPAQEFVVVVGTFAKPETVIGKLKAAKIRYYTEPISGKGVRVRAGPFRTRDAADSARAKIAALGLEPGAVSAK